MPDGTKIQEDIFDLNEVLGVTTAIRIKWDGEIYALKGIDALTPDELREWFELYQELGSNKALTEADGEEKKFDAQQFVTMGDMLHRLIRLLSPPLADKGLGFLAEAVVIKHYWEKVEKTISPEMLQKKVGSISGEMLSAPLFSGMV